MTMIYAHRGLHRLERENTLAAFHAAVALGVDGVELDVRRSADGLLVVHHDPAAEGQVIAHTNAVDLPGYVPTLEAAMDALEGVKVNVEIKNIREPSEPTYDSSGEFARQVLEFLSGAGWTPRVIISCFDEATCAQVRALDPAIEVGWLLWGVDLSSALVRARALGLTAVHPHFSTVNGAAMTQAGELGIDVNVWTVNETPDIERMASLGVASIITDDPALARTVLEGDRFRTDQ
jgi:glycerophosphoryl diester phosphodiesterase